MIRGPTRGPVAGMASPRNQQSIEIGCGSAAVCDGALERTDQGEENHEQYSRD